VGDRAAKRGVFGHVGIDMDELLILGDLGKSVDARLIDLEPTAKADLGADKRR